MEGVISELGLVVAAAGSSQRFGDKGNKLLQHLHGVPLVCHCLRRLWHCVPADQIAVMVRPEEMESFETVLGEHGFLDAGVSVKSGGRSRSESVYAGVKTFSEDVTLVAVQDAARPFTSGELLRRCVTCARTYGSGVAARAVTDTIKTCEASGKVTATLDRSSLAATETPQVFSRPMLMEAYEYVLANNVNVTDDGQAAECLGNEVYLVFHEEENPKITYSSDLALYEQCDV